MVIAIIGLLSAIVLVSLQKARERAKIAASLQFSVQLYHGLGADAAGVWNFNDNFNDSSGNGYNGQNFGVTFVNNDLSGELKKAGYFDGNDYVLITDSPDFDTVSGSEGFTWEVWIKPISLSGTYNMVMGHYVPYLCVYGSPGTLVFNYSGGGIVYGSNTNIENNKWYHLAAVYDKNRYITLYFNGKENKKEGPYNVSNHDSNFYIGTWSFALDGKFNGYIDDVRVYKKGLNSAEIRKHYVEGVEKRRIAIE